MLFFCCPVSTLDLRGWPSGWGSNDFAFRMSEWLDPISGSGVVDKCVRWWFPIFVRKFHPIRGKRWTHFGLIFLQRGWINYWLMVNWWFGFVGSPFERDCCLWVPRIPNQRDQNHQFTATSPQKLTYPRWNQHLAPENWCWKMIPFLGAAFSGIFAVSFNF